ncbi:Proliferating cellular nuclear antigen 1 [Zancudomyces culisetae]|uniref:DNA sliding clamp PCNA n=1 Tax=Zancudomyces culisetae TaxID=1213189 RepID=A0A1R1PP14_ZANCU|nr:Proliferating cellular nuclear antigen 1 [Zancudomyces culisetae]OMH82643.1 Proliferating cellular nuclear antigen 1 [Zancudomyces culisetae]|eukprot:OMH80648.1 Proliferating cellular nuclear antigen 1 [Zancudomyces culisetae]
MLEARLLQASILKGIVESVKDLVREANFDCSDSGISFQAMDESNVALSSFLLRAEGFETYRCDRNLSLGVRFSSLSKILKCANNDDIVVIRAEDDADVLNFVFESPDESKISEYQIKLLDIDGEHLSIPEQEFDCVIKMSSSEFSKLCRDMTLLGQTVVIDAAKEGVKFSTYGDIGAGSVLYKHSSSIDDSSSGSGGKGRGGSGGMSARGCSIELREPVSLELSLKYLNNFTKAAPLSDYVVISASNEIPVMVQFDVGDIGYIRYYLAPQIKDTE